MKLAGSKVTTRLFIQKFSLVLTGWKIQSKIANNEEQKFLLMDKQKTTNV